MAVEICKRCDGSGEITIDVGTHSSEYEYHKCKNCKGSGKVHKYTFMCEIPYDSNLTMVSNAQTKIFNIIRELEEKTKE